MKEKIVIKRFSVLEDIEIDINKINILIGEQATGKSLIAKLVYFFKSELVNSVWFSIYSKYSNDDLHDQIKGRFNLLFPDYILKAKGFEIKYAYGERVVTISNQPGKTFKSILIDFNEELLKQIKELFVFYNTQIDKIDVSDLTRKQVLTDRIIDELRNLFFGELAFPYFIPDNRTFIHGFERNLPLLLAKTGGYDYFLEQFGQFLYGVKFRYSSIILRIKPILLRECEDILGGKYEFDGLDDWIKTGNEQYVKLKDASSGQQEVLPLLLSLQEISTYIYKNYIFIEEPETHLFPLTQCKVVEIIALVYNILKRKSVFFITTHSPYILTAFNNLIQAHNTEMDIRHSQEDDKIKENKLNDLKKIVISEKRIPFEDVSIYMIGKGECRDIRNLENKLIDVNIIDEVSNQTASVFDELMNLSYGD